MDWFDLAVQDSQESSPAPQFERISSLAFSLLYGYTHKKSPEILLTCRFSFASLGGAEPLPLQQVPGDAVDAGSRPAL